MKEIYTVDICDCAAIFLFIAVSLLNSTSGLDYGQEKSTLVSCVKLI